MKAVTGWIAAIDPAVQDEPWSIGASFGMITVAQVREDIENHMAAMRKQVALSASRRAVQPLTSQMFEDAVEHIRAHGWCQRSDVDLTTGAVCARGALALERLGEGLPQYDEARFVAVTARRKEVLELMGINPVVHRNLMAWNDAEGRTEEEVIDALTLAAKKLRDEGR